LICLLSGGGVIINLSAARLKCSSSATATKYRSLVKSMSVPSALRGGQPCPPEC